MATGSPSEVCALVVALAASRSPTLGHCRVICIDGPAGSGKTTLGRLVARATGGQLISTDDLMDGWEGVDEVAHQLLRVYEALEAGEPATYERYDWVLGRYEETVPVAPADWLVVEGVSCGAEALAAYPTVLVWVEVPDDLRLARGLARDGADLEPRWRQFMDGEREWLALEGIEERADVLVDGTGATPPVVR